MAPCKDCTLRYPGCHDGCEGYQKYKKEREQIIAKRNKENELYYADRDRTIASVKKRRN